MGRSARLDGAARVWGTIVVFLAATASAADQRVALEHVERRPYRVSMRVGIADDPSLTAFARERALADLRAAATATFGAAWRVEVVAETSSSMTTAADLERLEAATLLAPDGEPAFEKLFLVTLAADRGRYTAAAREYDATVRRLGNVVVHESARSGDLGELMFRAVHDAYAPLVLVEELAGRHVVVRPFGAEFTPPDRSAAAIGPGSLLVPYLRYLDRTGEVGHVVPIPWTYLRVPDEPLDAETTAAFQSPLDVDDTLLVAETISGLQSPMGTKIRRRVQVLALWERPAFDATTVALAPTNAPGTPAAGVRVQIVRKLHAGDEGVGEPLERTTDRLGRVVVPRDDAAPLTWLYVHSGSALLARVPIVAGGARRLTFPIPDDEPRLTVEGGIELLQADLIDAVAEREPMLRRATILARDGKWREVDRLLPEVRTLPTATDFERRLSSITTPALQRARASGNGRAVYGIEKLADKTRARIRRFLDAGRITELLAELDELRSLDAGDPASLREAGIEP
jgi:hypothetical protein